MSIDVIQILDAYLWNAVTIISPFISMMTILNSVIPCFKSTHGSCIYFILTNRKHCFMHTGVVETGVSNFHLIPFTMFKSTYEKLSPKVFYYRRLRIFDLNEFNQDIYINMNKFQSNVYNEFENIYTTIL